MVPITPGFKQGLEEAERRRIKRRHLIYYLRVTDSNTGNLMGHLVDINTQGIMLMSEEQIEPGMVFSMSASWHNLDQKEESVQFKAESRWCKKDVNPTFYLTGYKLIDVSHEAFGTIQDLIEDLGFDD